MRAISLFDDPDIIGELAVTEQAVWSITCHIKRPEYEYPLASIDAFCGSPQQ
jgi:hypothetical protein